MSKDPDRQFKEFADRVKRGVNELVRPQTLSALSYEVVRIMKTRTRLGYGADKEGAPKKRLAPLSKSYKIQRKRIKKQGMLSSSTGPRKSNLTLSGKMLDDLTSRPAKSGINIGFKTQRSSKIAGYHEDGTPNMPRRAFMNLSRQDLKQIKAFLQDHLFKLVSRLKVR